MYHSSVLLRGGYRCFGVLVIAVSHPSCSCGVRRPASTKCRLGVRQLIRSAIGIHTHMHHPTVRARSIDRRALTRYERYRLGFRQPIRSAISIDTHIHQPTSFRHAWDRQGLCEGPLPLRPTGGRPHLVQRCRKLIDRHTSPVSPNSSEHKP